jgi:two-component system LytT family response regulator
LHTYCPQVRVAALCKSADEGIAAIQTHRPQLVFLDIEMPRKNGFEVIVQFPEPFFDVIFTTAYDQFAIKAFKYSALNYLLKPIDPDDLVETVRRVEEKKAAPQKEQIELLLQNLKQPAAPALNRIALTTSDGLLFADAADILYCEALSNYTSVVLKTQKVLVSKTLKEIDEVLSGGPFYRIHHSYLINLNQVQKYVRGEGGYVMMPDGKSVSISRAKRQEFVEMFSRF